MMIYEKAGDRFMVMLSAGNLSISQSVREILQVEKLDNGSEEPADDLERATACSTRCACWARRCAASTSRTGRR
jgi:predicted proteasome-type protease